MQITEMIRDIFLNPNRAFRNAGYESPGETMLFYLAILAISSLLSSLVAYDGFLSALLIFTTLMISGLIMLLVATVWLHIWVFLFGGRESLLQTCRIFVYGSAPMMLIGWLPFFGIIGILWSFVLWIIGVRELQHLRTPLAVITVVLPVALLMILLAALIFIAVLVLW